ncbi:DNA internalization-related competence protein ComEC/Rec2 [Microbulbifer sp. YPW16]|uniref:DNA internalization-related competence protein ComEC/Rec2 n=1 Tax=Microbulbifer sp. YPW16 TaxID=2904242 RepID=UPI001E294CF2|nr:DNA internalization-related competence protein ComEC/Rec2 [Microbulbifer sp. YPW16]UHQ55777.1 DNA internalization-related competence protein ComEC/Rec2 [Microbulbifer sp. YPW16]
MLGRLAGGGRPCGGFKAPTILMLWCYACGIAGTGYLPQLPGWWVWLGAWLGVWGLATLLCLARPGLRQLLPLLLAACLGSGWALWSNQQALHDRLPLELHGSDFLLPVEISSLPERAAGRDPVDGPQDVRFVARVLGAPDMAGITRNMPGQELRLTWYRASPDFAARLRAGTRWLLPVRLKRPRGSVNPHSFDYEGWLLRQGIYATGYVRPRDATPRFLGRAPGIQVMRESLRDRLARQDPPRLELVQALLLGDRSGLRHRDKQLLRVTGTAHLVAISGLHVGMVAGFFALAAGLLCRVAGGAGWQLSPLVMGGAAILASLAYTLLAGAPLSAQRAMVMTAVFMLALAWGRRTSAGLAYAVALALVLTLQPLAAFSPGFWLSFVAVGALLLAFCGRSGSRSRAGNDLAGGTVVGVTRLWAQKLWRGTLGLARGQWVVTLFLLVPSLLFFSGVSIAGFAVNLVAVPWIGIVILPLLMLGALLGESGAGALLIGLAGQQLDLLMEFLGLVGSLGAWQPLGFAGGPASLALCAVCLLLLALPNGIPGRHCGWLFAILLAAPLLFPEQREPRGLRLTVFDVGQGLAVLAGTGQAHLLYDTGPRSRSGWNAGAAIVSPYLLGEGIGSLDTVVVSHGDSDHSGGLADLLASVPAGQVRAPGTLAPRLGEAAGMPAARCQAGDTFHVGAAWAEVLWPGDPSVSGEDNDHSCVVALYWRDLRILLAGDISARVESRLVDTYPSLGPFDLLVAPHHGSGSSSSRRFVDWASPRHVVFSAGFRHHFGHPHPKVVARYRASGARVYNTADSGALFFSWDVISREPNITFGRVNGKFWLNGPVKK